MFAAGAGVLSDLRHCLCRGAVTTPHDEGVILEPSSASEEAGVRSHIAFLCRFPDRDVPVITSCFMGRSLTVSIGLEPRGVGHAGRPPTAAELRALRSACGRGRIHTVAISTRTAAPITLHGMFRSVPDGEGVLILCADDAVRQHVLALMGLSHLCSSCGAIR
ncbi:hypothetical protein SAMN04487782_0194 [Stenotrophomonas maltophilia]|nr:hypothetical protein SAMN04487782_0194 [Stenotrophomonas maltophilia]